MARDFKVSICMITYNHEKYIREAIEGVLMQKCNFEIELIIANDASLDKTDVIINQIINTHKKGSLIKYTWHIQNKGMMPNFIWALEQCKGKYIALCEGDDYWTDPFKLQKQIDFLENNNDYAICFHRAEQINSLEKNETNIIPKVNRDKDFTIHDYISNNHTATCSIVFNKKYFYPIPNWFYKVIFGDLGLVLSILKNSNGKKGRMLKDVMGVYRIHRDGIHGRLHKSNATLIDAYELHLQFFKEIRMNLLVEKEYKRHILTKFRNTCAILGVLYNNEGQIINSLKFKLNVARYNLIIMFNK